ncbi:uncharacterized protein LOC131845183 [Achroia grisella]|uniref:uncharacterized protein LOC131845183 n=1 Tax=Achroia grisella TaxID=688607 RepID=UPI0027D2F336|nr:uncharacterized protein LOC131845183 [Achroia grisella]
MERRRRSRLDASEPMTKAVRRREKPRERWLLTRKTWKYMSDAGRRLIPDGAQNRPEDVPRIEAYFQEVCAKEPKFLLWRKSSYPGALPRPRRKKRPRGGSVRARSPSDEIPPPPVRPTDLFISHTSGGRFDIAKLRRDFFATPPSSASTSGYTKGKTVNDGASTLTPVEDDENNLVDLLRKYLKLEEEEGVSKVSESEELVRSLKKYLKRESERTPTDTDTDPGQRTLLENLSRYYGRSSNRDHIVQDILTDRNLLKRLYHDLRKTKPYRGSRGGGGAGAGGSGYGPSGYSSATNACARNLLRPRTIGFIRNNDGEDSLRSPPMSPPPLIEVFSESLEDKYVDSGTQTVPVPEEILVELERLYREKQEVATVPTSPTSPPPDRRPTRRRSSVDHDDVSQSVSDTIKRYLRMARKKSVDADKADQFKRINYDKNLRNIKPKAPGVVDDDGPHKGCQTEEAWILTYRDLQFASVASTPTSPPSPASPSQSHSFLSTLLGRSAPTVAPPPGGMQKSRSSSSVVQSVSKRLWRTRSRSSSRATATWTPQGSCCWVDGSGRCVRLTDTSLLTLTEVERRALQQVALAKLHEMKLGIPIKIPEENAVAASTKPKRRAYLLKRKALTTGFFDQSRTKDEKDKDSSVGSVFGVPLAQCVETERALRRQHGGSRASLASLGALEKGDDSESCDSGDWAWSGLEETGGPKIPALVAACLAHLRRHGLHTIGLFRVSASKKRVRQLREEWERGQCSALDAAACPHDVATLLKEFLRDLPDPLLCRDLYQAFLHTQKIRSRRLQWEALRLIVQLLPAAHRDTLSALLSFLAQLATHSEDDHQPGNKMDAANLATVFAPNILHRNKPNEAASAEQLSERADVINVVRQLVERQQELWPLPAAALHLAYVHLLHAQPAHLDALLLRRAQNTTVSASAVDAASVVGASPPAETGGGSGGGGGGGGGSTEGGVRRVWSREEFLHGAAATGGPHDNARRSDKTYSRTRRTRETASDTSSGSFTSTMTIVTSGGGLSGGLASSARNDSAADSNDSASDYNETLGGSDDDSCVITASLHIPAASVSRARPAPPPRRRSTSGSESSAKRDSAVGSSPSAFGSSAASSAASASASASAASSPPASPPPVLPSSSAVRVTLSAAGEVRRAPDIDKLISLGRERNTSDARAVVLRQHDESSTRMRISTRQEHTIKREEHSARREDQSTKRDERREGTTLYKRGELISSARSSTT